MITLTTPKAINSVLGANTTVSYERMILSHIEIDTVAQTISCAVTLISTSVPAQQRINGSLFASVTGLFLDLQIPQISFFKKITLTNPQATNLLGQIQTAQNQIEAGLVTLAVVAGTQSTGA